MTELTAVRQNPFFFRRNLAAAALAVASIIVTVSGGLSQQAALTPKKLKEIMVSEMDGPYVMGPSRRFDSKLEPAPGHQFTLYNENSSRPMFLFRGTGCAFHRKRLDCRKGGDFQIPVLIVAANEAAAPGELHLVPSTSRDTPLALFQASFDPSHPQNLITYWVLLKEIGSIATKMPIALVVCMPGACSTDRSKDNNRLVNLAEAAKPEPAPRFGAQSPQQTARLSPPAPASPPAIPVRADSARPKSGDTGNIVIDVTVNHVPRDYDDRQLKRLILSSMRGGSADQVVKIEVQRRDGLVGKSEVTVRQELVRQLTFAGTPVSCGAGFTACQAEIALKEWLLDVGSLPPGPAFALLPGISLDTGNKRRIEVLKRLGVEIDSLNPILAQPPDRTIIRVYLFDESNFRVDLQGIQMGADAPFTQIRGSIASRKLRLARPSKREPFELRTVSDIATRDDPRVIVGTGTSDSKRTPDPKPVTSRVHIVLKPTVPTFPGWTQARVAKRLKQLLDNVGYRRVPSDGASAAGTEPISLTKAEDGVIISSALRPQAEQTPELPTLPVGISSRGSAAVATAAPALQDARIRPTDLVSIREVEIAIPQLYDKWTLQVEPFNRSYRKDVPDTSNDKCTFSLNASGESPIRLEPRTVNNKKVLRASVDPATLAKLEGKITVTVMPADKDANCAHSSPYVESVTRWSASEDGADGVRSTRAFVSLRGRWLLGLYASQDLGSGGSASEHVLRETKFEVFKQFVAYLESARGQHFRDTPPASSTLGFDMALLRSGTSSGDFQESSVVVGKFRKSATNAFRLDAEAERRLLDFVEATSAESPPAFALVGDEIKRYSALFGELSNEDYPPAAIYLGAATPVPDSCKQWRDMAQRVDTYPGRPRVFGVVFASMSAAQLGKDLGPDAKPISLATLTRGYVCDAQAGSALLFVPFFDLTTRDPTTLLQAIFGQIDRWLARRS